MHKRNFMRFILAVVLTLLVIGSAISTGFCATNTDKGFSDIKGDEWFSTDLTSAVQLGIINGFPDGTFRQDRIITYAEFLTAAIKAKGETIPVSTGAGSTVKWYDGVIAKAVSMGVLDSKYDLPDYTDEIPREKMAEYTCKILSIPADTSGVQNFVDVNKYNLNQEWVNAAFYNYLVRGTKYYMNERTFGYDKAATRAQLATMVMRIQKYSVDKVAYMQEMKVEFEALELAQDKKDSSIGGYSTPDGKPFVGGTLEVGGYLQYTVTGDFDYSVGDAKLTHKQSVDYLRSVLSSKFSVDTVNKVISAGEGTITPPSDLTRPAGFSLQFEGYNFAIIPTGGDIWTLDVGKIV